MNYLGISYDYRNKPLLDPGFIPFGVWAKAFLDGAERPFKAAVERDGGHVSVFSSFLRGEKYAEANLLIDECNRVLAEEYPELAAKVTVMLPDEKARRVGQSIAAASLPEV